MCIGLGLAGIHGRDFPLLVRTREQGLRRSYGPLGFEADQNRPESSGLQLGFQVRDDSFGFKAPLYIHIYICM